MKNIFRKYIKLNKNENSEHQYLYDAAKATLRRKFIELSTHIRKERFQSSDFS